MELMESNANIGFNVLKNNESVDPCWLMNKNTFGNSNNWDAQQ
jgi:hypothetical protein